MKSQNIEVWAETIEHCNTFIITRQETWHFIPETATLHPH